MTFGEFIVRLIVSVMVMAVVSFAIGKLSYELAELIRRRRKNDRL